MVCFVQKFQQVPEVPPVSNLYSREYPNKLRSFKIGIYKNRRVENILAYMVLFATHVENIVFLQGL